MIFAICSMPATADGVYFVTFKTTAKRTAGAAETSQVKISTRILANTGKNLDSPLRGVLVRSSGQLEQGYLSALATRFNTH